VLALTCEETEISSIRESIFPQPKEDVFDPGFVLLAKKTIQDNIQVDISNVSWAFLLLGAPVGCPGMSTNQYGLGVPSQKSDPMTANPSFICSKFRRHYRRRPGGFVPQLPYGYVLVGSLQQEARTDDA
jgi:hypothetical protein